MCPMKKFLSLFFLLSVSCFFAQDLEQEGKQEEPDMSALRKWLMEKRLVTVKEKGGDLSIAGEVRTELQATNEKKMELIKGVLAAFI